MSAIRATDTRMETRLRSALHRRGLRFRKNMRTLPGRPDIVFPAARVVVFVDGDFWHARAVRETSLSTVVATFPRRSYRYWQNKFAARIERDDKVSEELMRGGWHVIRIWESELRLNLERHVKEIAHQVRARSS